MNPLFDPVSLSNFSLSLEGLYEKIVYVSACSAFTSLLLFGLQLFAFWLLSPWLPWYFFGKSIKKYLLPHQINTFFQVFPYLSWMRHFHFWQFIPRLFFFFFFDIVLLRLSSDSSFLLGFFSHSDSNASSFFIWSISNLMYSHSFYLLAHSYIHQIMPVVQGTVLLLRRVWTRLTAMMWIV